MESRTWSLLRLLATSVAWLWPLQYALVDGECGADIGSGLYVLFVAGPTGLWSLVHLVRTRTLQWIDVTAALLGVTAFVSLMWTGPWKWWLYWAADQWYSAC